MDSPALLDLTLSLVVSRVKEAVACGLIAIVLSATCVQLDPYFLIASSSPDLSFHRVYGITVLQAYIYFRSTHRDSLYLTSFVSGVNMVKQRHKL